MARWDAKNLEIRTRSVEQTLVPLVAQITTLVNLKDRIKLSDRATKSLQDVGANLQKAIQAFTEIGEAIAKEDPEISDDMNEACCEAVRSADEIAKLINVSEYRVVDKLEVVQASRILLGAITRSLLLADVVAVKKLVRAATKVDDRLRELETVHNFTDFVQAFSQFGADMVELAHISGDRQNDLKDDKQRAEMCASRAILEKSTMMLLTTCKTCLRHPESPIALGNRNGVFKSMRDAMDSLRGIVQDNVIPPPEMSRGLGMDLKDFEVAVEVSFQRPDDTEVRTEITEKLDIVTVESENLVNTEIIPSIRRSKITALCKNLRDLLQELLEGFSYCQDEPIPEKLRNLLRKASKIVEDLKSELTQVALELVLESFSNPIWKESLTKLKQAAVSGEPEGVHSFGDKIMIDSSRMQEVSKVVRNITESEPVVITARRIEENMKTFLPQLIDAARILSGHPSSKITQENMEVFADVWETQVEELTSLLRNVMHVDKRRSSESETTFDAFFTNTIELGEIASFLEDTNRSIEQMDAHISLLETHESNIEDIIIKVEENNNMTERLAYETPVEACVYVSESSENRISDDHGTDLPSFDVDELIKEQEVKTKVEEDSWITSNMTEVFINGTSVEAYAHANKSTDSSITEDHLADPVASDTGEQSPKSENNKAMEAKLKLVAAILDEALLDENENSVKKIEENNKAEENNKGEEDSNIEENNTVDENISIQLQIPDSLQIFKATQDFRMSADPLHLELVTRVQLIVDSAQILLNCMSTDVKQPLYSTDEMCRHGEVLSSSGEEIYHLLRELICKDLPEENRSEVISITNKIRMHSHTLRFTCKSYTVGEKALSLKIHSLLQETKKVATYAVKAVDLFLKNLDKFITWLERAVFNKRGAMTPDEITSEFGQGYGFLDNGQLPFSPIPTSAVSSDYSFSDA